MPLQKNSQDLAVRGLQPAPALSRVLLGLRIPRQKGLSGRPSDPRGSPAGDCEGQRICTKAYANSSMNSDGWRGLRTAVNRRLTTPFSRAVTRKSARRGGSYPADPTVPGCGMMLPRGSCGRSVKQQASPPSRLALEDTRGLMSPFKRAATIDAGRCRLPGYGLKW